MLLYSAFPTEYSCIEFLEAIRWQSKPICPYCEHRFTTAVPSENRHRCNYCHTSFSVTVATVFHKTRMPLRKWFLAAHLTNSVTRVRVRELAQLLKINKNTAARILAAIYGANQSDRQWLFLIREEINGTDPSKQ